VKKHNEWFASLDIDHPWAVLPSCYAYSWHSHKAEGNWS
jgi:hypothetical protein